MKNLNLTFVALAFAAVYTFTGCQTEDVVPATDATVLVADESLQITEVNDVADIEITVGSETSAFSASTAGTQHYSRRLAYILHNLNLREKQVSAVKAFIAQHEACVKEHHASIKLLQQELFARANAVRESYISEYRAGNITKQELEVRLTSLREKLAEEIRKHAGIKVHVAIMHRCRAALFAKIETILGPEQLAKWTQWKNGL